MNRLVDPRARIVIAHRGASAELPENTLAAFERAVELGADGFELDVRLSADGVAVVVHDPTLDRTTSLGGPVSEYTAAEMAQAGVPTLEALLQTFPGTPVLIEVKEVQVQAATTLAVSRTGAQARCVMASEQHDALGAFRSPPFLVGASGRDITRAWLGALLGVRPPGNSSSSPVYHCASVPLRHHGLPVPTRRLVQAMHARSIAIHVWTVDDEATALQLWTRGVNGIVTNDPRRMVAARSRT